jgi:hypothetical protein
MNPGKKAKPAKNAAVVALALTWDGSRWPLRSLSAAARSFLRTAGANVAAPRAQGVARGLENGAIREMRICWVPRLKGGSDVLSSLFVTPDGQRAQFRVAQWKQFGEVLGVVYRRAG